MSATGDGQTGTVQALPARSDSEYGIIVDIGTPPQSIPLNLDTGSSDLYAYNSPTLSSSSLASNTHQLDIFNGHHRHHGKRPGSLQAE